jgi:hypothetical protein
MGPEHDDRLVNMIISAAMNLRQKAPRLSLAAFGLGGLLLSGCVGFTVKPPKPDAMPRADAPVPLKVGVRMKKPRFEWQGMGMMNTSYMEAHRDRWMIKPMFVQSDDVGGKFLRALQASSGFSQVDEVKNVGFNGTDDDPRDLIIDADFSGKYTQDPAGFGKAFITGFLFFIPAPFIRFEDAYFAAADLSVYDGTGRLLHKYSERQDVATSAALFSAGAPASVSAGIESASANLAAKLVTEILADRPGYLRAIKQASKVPPKPAAAPPAPAVPAEIADAAPVAAASAAPVFAPAPAPSDPVERVMAHAEAAQTDLAAEEAKTEPTPPAQASAEPEPVRRGPLSSAEEKEIDEQVMP